MRERQRDAGGSWSTPYTDVNIVVLHFLAGVRGILTARFRGMYLSGLLALGDFAHDRSDIDFVAVTDAEVTEDELVQLQALHARFNASDSPWATEVEAAYIPKDALRRYDPAHARHPHIERGADEVLDWDQLASDWVLQRHMLRTRGVIVAGPPPSALIDPVSPDEMRHAVVGMMDAWWGTMPVDPAPLRRRGEQAYTVLSMCRVLYTLDVGDVVSKPTAARWARTRLDARWARLIDRALAWRKEDQQTLDGDVEETVALIKHARARCII